MDKELIDIANKYANSAEKMADTTEKIGNMLEKMMTKIDEETVKSEKRHGRYYAKSGDKLKLATDITIPGKEKKDVDPELKQPDEVIKAGTIITVNVILRHGDLAYQLVYKEPITTVFGHELKELRESGILEEV